VNWGIITANALSALAVLVALIGVWKADKRAGEAVAQAREADARAEESTDAAKRSADAVERVAAALERQSIEAERRAEAPGVVWRLEHFQGDAYLLTNAGRATAYDLRVDLGAMAEAEPPKADSVQPGDAVKFYAAVEFGTPDDTVRVTWANEPGGERSSWARPLPPRPPRSPFRHPAPWS
jgi:hypothetical protein